MMDEAIKLAKNNPTDLNKMGAVITKRSKVLGRGMNSRRSHPLQFAFSKSHLKISLHAEISAIIDALRNHSEEELVGASVFVARILKDGSRAKAKPCEICQRALKAYGIKGVYWTEYNSDSNCIR